MQTTTKLTVNNVTFYTETGAVPQVQYIRDQPPVNLPANVTFVYAGAPLQEAFDMLAKKDIFVDPLQITNNCAKSATGKRPQLIPNTYLVFVTDDRYIVVYHVRTWMEVMMDHEVMVRFGKDSASRVADLLEDPVRVKEFFSDLMQSDLLNAATGDATMDLDTAAQIAIANYESGDDDSWNMSVVYAAYMYVRIFGRTSIEG